VSCYDHLTPAQCPVVKVDWADITEFPQWNDREDVQTTDVVTTGWLLEDSPKWIVVASSYSYTDETWASVCIFPTQMPAVTYLGPAPVVDDGDDSPEFV